METQKVLFLCTGNSARSQMAEGWLRHLAGARYEALSAGTAPGGLNPLAVAAMKEIGIDISRQRSKNVTGFSADNMQYVITVCDNAKESCPIFPGAYQFVSWSLDDPAAATGTEEDKMAVFRRVRDEVGKRIREQFLTGAEHGE